MTVSVPAVKLAVSAAFAVPLAVTAPSPLALYPALSAPSVSVAAPVVSPVLRPTALSPVALAAAKSDVPVEAVKAQAGQRFDGEPVAPVVDHTVDLHGVPWSDPYHWMTTYYGQKPSDAVLAHAKEERDFARSYFHRAQRLTTRLRAEMKSRESASLEPGKDRSGLAAGRGRRPGVDALLRRGRVVVDAADWLPKSARKAALEKWEAAPDGRRFILTYRVDGRARTFVHDRRSGETTELSSNDTLLDVATWAADGKTVVWSANSLLLNRGKVWAMVPGGPKRRLFDSDDASSSITLSKSEDGRRLFIEVGSFREQSAYVMDADLLSPARAAAKPLPGVFDHVVDGGKEVLLRRSNPGGWYDLWRVGADGALSLLLAGSREDDIMEAAVYGGRLVVTRRRGSLPVLEVYGPDMTLQRTVAFDDPHYELSVVRADPRTGTLWIRKQSLLVPETMYTLSAKGTLRERSRTKTPDFDPAGYSLERRFYRSADGTTVPMTLVTKKGVTGKRPVLYTAYGAYDSPFELDEDHGYNLSFARSLLDRGFTVAIAHVRGGTENGFSWMMAGRGEGRERSIEDLLAGADDLVAAGIADPGKIAVHGYSAGGILVGAALARRPELFKAAVINMGYLDFVNSLLDAGLPSAELERTMYGDPTVAADFAWMRRLSPYDNLPKAAFPPVLLNTARDDWAVMFHESLKFAARLRAQRTGGGRVVVDMIGPGRGDHSGRYGRHDLDAARMYAFVLRELGLVPTKKP